MCSAEIQNLFANVYIIDNHISEFYSIERFMLKYEWYQNLLYLMIKSWTVIGRCSMFYKR